ncbi:MAG: c-type cytochrome, partial [Isosphaeraceae bacterium]|nr:c-type cytochrome [Isosphaeraceae bacterium]
MPGFGLDTHEVADLLAFLTEVAANAATTPVLTPEVQMALNVADPAKGRLLFRSVGCLGCHTRGDAAPDPDDRAAPDLADLGRQRSASWLASYLTHPKKSGAPARHRFDLRLSPDAAAHLAAYLVSDPPEPIPPPDLPRGDAARGRTLADRLRCASCHEIPGLKPLAADLPLRAGSNPNAGCLAEPPSGRSVPRFTLSSSQRAALRAFVAGLPARPSPTSRQVLAQDTIRRLHCLGCHARDGGGATWLGPQVAALLEQDPDLGALKGTLTPPNLSAVGDKLRPEYLAQALRGNAPSARPWLSVRMPSYPFQPGEAEAILAYFCAHDRQDPSPGPEPDEPTPRPDLVTIERGANLIGQRGFGCLSCHVLAGKIPAGGEPETLGPDLALAHRRMTSRYFRRWLADPQRIIPGTPMPQFLQP